MSFVSGLMLGIAILHLLPHATEVLGSSSHAAYFALGGIIGMFLLLRAFHSHSHSVPAMELPSKSLPVGNSTVCHAHADDHDHDHGPVGHEDSSDEKTEPVSTAWSWLGMVFGLGLHTMMDGVALAASVAADSHGAWLGLAGLGTFLAVALHKPLDAFSIGSVMRRSGWSLRERSTVNLCFSLACPTGALLFWVGATQLETASSLVIGSGLAVSAGFFICIALADLLPEVHFHDHDRGKLTLALFLGVLLAIGIENLPGHKHGGHNHSDHSADVRMNIIRMKR